MSADSESALSSRNYRTYLSGSTISLLGVWVQRLALGWHAWQLTESAFVVGLIASAQFIPLILLTPFFGVFADQVSARIASIVVYLVLAANAVALGLLTVTGHMTTEWLLFLALFHGVANSAYSPVRHSLIPLLVSRNKFASAVAINAIVFNVSRLVGPGIAGVVVARYGLSAAYFANALTYMPLVLVMSYIRLVREDDHVPDRKPYFAQLAEGFRYALAHVPIRQVILLAGVANFFGRGVLELMPAFAALVFGGGSGVLAALMAAAGVGAIIASLLFSSRSFGAHLHQAVVIGAVGVGVTTILFAFAENLVAGMLLVALLGLFASIVSIGSQTEVQVSVENRLRGRVMSIWTITIVGGPAIGSAVAGAVTGSIGSTWTILSFGVLCLLLISLVGLGRPKPPVAEAP
jgi:MFS family permease